MAGVAEPFSRFARHYDRFMMKYVDYPGWVSYVLRIFRRFRVAPRVILDLACGTGIPTIILAKKGYRVIGVDRSPEMLAVLESKRGSLPVRVVCSDIRRFQLDEVVDAAISLYDSINYLLTEEDLVDCFRCVRRVLAAHGIFVFDLNTLYGLAEQWGSRTITRETEDIVSLWQSQFDPKTRISTLQLTFWEKMADGSPGERFYEVHEERAYTQPEVTRALARAGFAEVHFYHHGGFLPVTPLTVRMMVVAKGQI